MTVRTARVAAVLALAATARAAAAQPASSSTAGPYERARRLVEQGQGALGRAIADSLVAASPPGSPALAEALWWRATLGADGTRAEQDLQRIVSEFPNSPRVGDALVRLAQLDIARDRPDVAAPVLERLVRERPDDPARAQAAYWLARARLELGDTRGGCLALADAAAWARSTETVTRQQVASLRQRLPACDPASVVSVMSGAPTSTPASTPTSPPASPPASTAAPVTPPPATASASRAPATVPAPVTASAGVEPVTRNPGERAPGVRDPESPGPGVRERVTASPAPETSRASTGATPSVSGNFAVQVAAYGERNGAAALAARLRARGFDARVTGSAAPFRVKIGHYATRAAAATARATFAAQGLAGFVTDAGP